MSTSPESRETAPADAARSLSVSRCHAAPAERAAAALTQLGPSNGSATRRRPEEEGTREKAGRRRRPRARFPRGERRRPTMQKVLIALFATGAAALAPAPATGVAANRREHAGDPTLAARGRVWATEARGRGRRGVPSISITNETHRGANWRCLPPVPYPRGGRDWSRATVRDPSSRPGGAFIGIFRPSKENPAVKESPKEKSPSSRVTTSRDFSSDRVFCPTRVPITAAGCHLQRTRHNVRA